VDATLDVLTMEAERVRMPPSAYTEETDELFVPIEEWLENDRTDGALLLCALYSAGATPATEGTSSWPSTICVPATGRWKRRRSSVSSRLEAFASAVVVKGLQGKILSALTADVVKEVRLRMSQPFPARMADSGPRLLEAVCLLCGKLALRLPRSRKVNVPYGHAPWRAWAG
jgi:hypothetical protein